MVVTGPAELLAAWEAGLARRAAGRAEVLHRAARPEASVAQLGAEPLGARVADLLVLRRALFGERMQVLLECAACGEAVEFDLDARGLADHPRPTGDPLRVVDDGIEVEFRLPTAADLDAAATAPAEQRGAWLLARCTLSAEHDGEPVEPADLPERVRRRMAELAEQADPAADLAVTVHCPHCGGGTPTVDSLPDAAPEADPPAAAGVPDPVLREREVRRTEREVHRTDRITVLRTESPVTEPPPRPDAPPQREPAEPVTSLVPPVPVVPSPEPPRAVRGVSALHGVSRTCTKSVKVIPRSRSTMTTGSRTRFHR